MYKNGSLNGPTITATQQTVKKFVPPHIKLAAQINNKFSVSKVCPNCGSVNYSCINRNIHSDLKCADCKHVWNWTKVNNV